MDANVVWAAPATPESATTELPTAPPTATVLIRTAVANNDLILRLRFIESSGSVGTAPRGLVVPEPLHLAPNIEEKSSQPCS